MIDHISIAVRDLKNAEAFYAALLAPLGLTKLREWPDAAIGFGKKYPEFWINKRAAMDRVASRQRRAYLPARVRYRGRRRISTPPRSRPAVRPTALARYGPDITAAITRHSFAISTAIALRR